jgi:hypothetical protein
MESSRGSLNLEQQYRDMLGSDAADNAYDFIGSVTESAWAQGLAAFVANGGNAYDWYQEMLRTFPAQKDGLFDIYKTFIDKYGFAQGDGDGYSMNRPTRNGQVSETSSTPWQTNEAAFLAVALSVLGIAIFVLRGK